MINGFDFNHAHADFFHFVNFYRGNQIFIDPGRKDYLIENKKYIYSKFHNSIVLNDRWNKLSEITKSKFQSISRPSNSFIS